MRSIRNTFFDSMRGFDIAPFALPRCEPGEIRFEEPRDIRLIIVTFVKNAPRQIGLSYLQRCWPERRVENIPISDDAFSFGWGGMDDWFNVKWRPAAIQVKRLAPQRIAIAFKGLAAEFPEMTDYNVAFRRTLGIRLEVPDPTIIRRIAVYTMSSLSRTMLFADLNAGSRTPGRTLRLEGYNAVLRRIVPKAGVRQAGDTLFFSRTVPSRIAITVDHVRPAHPYCGDVGRITFILDEDRFTISLADLEKQGPIFYAERSVFIHHANDTVDLSQYIRQWKDRQTLSQRVREHPEQTYDRAYYRQPHPHAVYYNIGVKHARQRFIIEPNGDIVLPHINVSRLPCKDTERFLNEKDGRFFFGFETWYAVSRFPDPTPVIAYNLSFRNAAVLAEQRSLAVPLFGSILDDACHGDKSVVTLARFHFRNTGTTPVDIVFDMAYSSTSIRSPNAYYAHMPGATNALIPESPRESLVLNGHKIIGRYGKRNVLRCMIAGEMTASTGKKDAIRFSKTLATAESCELVLKIPFIALETADELTALESLDFTRCDREVTAFWRREAGQGCHLSVPEMRINELHAAHLSHVQITDFEMPDGTGLINTSVGTSTYDNYSNESCMIINELDQRGLHEEARRRLEIWIRYQGTVPQPGNFTDCDGMYYGAGGFEGGAYNQHHGWVLWALAEHYFLTRDHAWLAKTAKSMIAGIDWVFRQRRQTMCELPHSRGWEYGFLPAGSLEDVTDFWYWLSTNALIWRGVDHAARALKAIKHPDAVRLCREATRYRRDLIRGFENMRQYSPLVRLRNGCWVPHYPSRLYCRGRDIGWIREVLEGAVYLLISGLYSCRGASADWILDDFQDNRYVSPPNGYAIFDFETNWFDRGGFSMQPNLLAGLLPYLERDEPEQYIRMFFNAWCACYRQEIGAMVEHPTPILGYSNMAHFKTSDQANALTWLRYMLIYADRFGLHFGKALPRYWLRNGAVSELTDLCTPYGKASVRYVSQIGQGRITLEADWQPTRRVLVRFRHPDCRPIRAVRVNGRRWVRWNPAKEDVDLTGLDGGRIIVEAQY